MGRTGKKVEKDCIMNDYFLRILIRQRHEQILAEVRAARLLQPGRSRATRGNKSIRLLRSFFAQWKRPLVFQPPAADERKSV